MSLIKSRIKQIEIIFQTLVVPPPYAHEYRLSIDFSSAQLQTSFQIKYTEREQLSEEEIIEEGFTLYDDFEWKGSLPKPWKPAILDVVASTNHLFESPKPDSQQVLELKLNYENDETEKGIPDNIEGWEYFTQEIIQAIYEISKKELPLKISYVELGANDKQTISVQPRFSHRSLTVMREKNGKKEEKTLKWEQLMPLLQTVYLPDYDPEKAKNKLPNKPGKYIDQGDGLWYKLGTAVSNPSKKKDAVGEMEKMFRSFF
ncbi:hypothetical protein OKW21_000266 [Catalinimonas alkaloidigena]|uniref:hypothetical protein n=1 Tax=Catalinimonas alkaloidigena TaxID=1075417 RepID=UPI002405C155|nr:hypothetical protein [Catalinimonas alkaloidigena]MDF9795003.1 hypothetical protein [Catalinimonas alkaloidigena]